MPASAPSFASRSASLRPIMPAPPMMRTFMVSPRVPVSERASRRSLSPLGRGCEAMTYGRMRCPTTSIACGAVSHSAELVRGLLSREGPLIRPAGTFSPRGEGHAAFAHKARQHHPSFTPQAAAQPRPSTVPRRGLYSQPTQPVIAAGVDLLQQPAIVQVARVGLAAVGRVGDLVVAGEGRVLLDGRRPRRRPRPGGGRGRTAGRGSARPPRR